MFSTAFHYGITRNVFLIGRYAIKIPRISNHLHFLQGCYSNWSERRFCKHTKSGDYETRSCYNMVAPSLWCSWFGIVQIQRRCIPLDPNPMSHKSITRPFLKKHFGRVCTDIKHDNFGWLEIDGCESVLVCLDYA